MKLNGLTFNQGKNLMAVNLVPYIMYDGEEYLNFYRIHEREFQAGFPYKDKGKRWTTREPLFLDRKFKGIFKEPKNED